MWTVPMSMCHMGTSYIIWRSNRDMGTKMAIRLLACIRNIRHIFVFTQSKWDTLFFALFFSRSNETWLFVDLFGLFRTREKTIVEGRLAKWGPFQKEKNQATSHDFFKNIRRLAKWGPFQKRKKSRNLSWF